MDDLAEKAKILLDRLEYDDSGTMGRGGNGGLISRETIQAAGELRRALFSYTQERKT